MNQDICRLRAIIPKSNEFAVRAVRQVPTPGAALAHARTGSRPMQDMNVNFDGFQDLFKQYMDENGRKITWSTIQPPPDGMVRAHSTLAPVTAGQEVALLKKLAVLKLNGGLGTSMGCVGPKSAISVRDDLTFLDLTVRQIEALNTKCARQASAALLRLTARLAGCPGSRSMCRSC